MSEIKKVIKLDEVLKEDCIQKLIEENQINEDGEQGFVVVQCGTTC